MAYNPSYSLDGLGGAPSATGDASSQQQSYQKYSGWTGDFTSGISQDQQQYQQQQPLMTSTVADQQSLNPPMTLPSATLAQSFADFVDTKVEPVPDEQNASFYFSNQCKREFLLSYHKYSLMFLF